MASAEAASNDTGPRYAPDDPTLPKPWKGLIDGSTGVTYYWNPETNVTQYEKPAIVPPPLQSGLPPVDITSQSAPQQAMQHGQIVQVSQYQQQYMNQLSQQQGQLQGVLACQVAQQQPAQMLPTGQQGSQMGAFQQHYANFGQGMPQGGSQMVQPSVQQPQIMQQPYGAQMLPPTGQQMLPQQVSQMVKQPIQHTPPMAGQQTSQPQGTQVGQSQGHHFVPQQIPYGAYQQPMLPRGQQNAQPHSQQMPQGPTFLHQHENTNRFPPHDDSEFCKIKQTEFSVPQVEQSGLAIGQGPPSMNAPNHALQAGPISGQSQSFGSSVRMHQPTSSVQLQESGNDVIHSQHGSAYQNQMGQSTMHPQQHGLPALGSKMGYDNNQQVRAGQGYHFNANNEAPVMAPQHPKLAALPTARNQQDMLLGGFPPQNAPPTRDNSLNTVASHGVHSMFNHANGDLPMPNHAMSRPPPVIPGAADVMNISSAEAYRQQHEVTATGENVPAPFMTFEATGFPSEILREMHSAGFSSPTPIQAQTWPIALQGRDIVAIAKTGSGKTLGYLIPAFMHLRRWHNNPRHGPTVLVLAPTRELATQIQDEAIKFGRSSRLSCTCLYGGAPKGPQLEELRRGADIVVATPGRLNDILETRNIDVRQVSLLVLDEADRMLDMGFEPQIRKIVNEIPPQRQTLMYTATWPKEVRKIASDLLNNPVQVNIGNADELVANKSITQYVEVVPQMEKQRRLEQILRAQERGSKVIIFCSTKKLCDELTRSLRRFFPAAAIHGDKSQGERDYVLNQFRSGKSPILVATDVAARGLDIKDIRVVINYDFPTGVEDYVHRIGRTGRAGATGVAYTFFCEQDWKHAGDLVKVLEGANQPVPPEVREIAMRGGAAFGKDRSSGASRFGAGPNVGTGRWDAGGRGGTIRDGGFGGRGGMRDGGFGGRGGFGSRGGPMRDGGFGGRGMRDGAMSSRGGRSDFMGRGNRGRGGFGGPGGNYAGRSRDDYSSHERFSRDGFGRSRGRGRFDNRRDGGGRSRGRSQSPSPEKVRTWGYSRSSSRSRSRSRSRSWSRSPRRRYSLSRSRSPRRSYSRSRSRSRSYDRYKRADRRGFEQGDPQPEKQSEMESFEQKDATASTFAAPAEPQLLPMGAGENSSAIPRGDTDAKTEDCIQSDPVSSVAVNESAGGQ